MTTRHTAALGAAELDEIRDLLDAAFDDFDDHDWEHGLGGQHAVVREDGLLVAHGSLVQRRMLVGGRSLRVGYVEAVAVHPDRRRLGHASTVMAALEALAPAYDLLALSASDAGLPLYEARGWQPWRGPTSVLGPTGPEPTPDDDGSVLVLVLGGQDVDRDLPIACDHRDGDVW
ncbi:GNAT family N-acetyltransferase [Nocardioides lianchengensis]|uniref:GNAT family N-acetyltransferase n=1 Tax=Nocardioides lianchengensis TaxID=1045774 RepID=UPI00183BA3BE|nr:GNAT family N-acetyltransferase [Nocardioides lianchengensis]NYG10800.1 aminoglycoside 2'-N-acetyltransferase I [Nocardioides lianchengensis]